MLLLVSLYYSCLITCHLPLRRRNWTIVTRLGHGCQKWSMPAVISMSHIHGTQWQHNGSWFEHFQCCFWAATANQSVSVSQSIRQSHWPLRWNFCPPHLRGGNQHRKDWPSRCKLIKWEVASTLWNVGNLNLFFPQPWCLSPFIFTLGNLYSRVFFLKASHK